MSNKQCYSFASCENLDIFPENNCSSFQNLFDLDNSKGDYYIGLDFITVSTFLENKFKGQRCDIEIDAVQEQENGGCDCCIASIIFPNYKAQNPVFIPFISKKFSHISIKLLKTVDKTLFLAPKSTDSEHTRLSFQVKKMFHGQKRLYASFTNNCDLFPENTPLHFTNLISPLFAGDIDFTKWEIAVEHIYINDTVLKKSQLKRYFLIYTNIIEPQMLADKYEKVILGFPNNWDRKSSFMSYRPGHNIFLNMNISNLDRIHVDIDMFQNNDTVFREEEEKKRREEMKNCEITLTFVLRNKYM